MAVGTVKDARDIRDYALKQVCVCVAWCDVCVWPGAMCLCVCVCGLGRLISLPHQGFSSNALTHAIRVLTSRSELQMLNESRQMKRLK